MKAMPESETDVMTPEEVAKWLHLEKRQLERFGIPCLHLGHKTRRYLRSDVMTWLKQQRQVSPSHHSKHEHD